MSNWTKGLLTAAGRLLLAKVEVGSASLQFSRIELGSGVSSGDRSAATSLVSSRTSSGISSVIRDGETIKVTASFTSMNISSMFYVTEMGLYAKDPDVGDILFMVATDSAPDPMPSKTYNQPITFTYTMEVFVSSDLSITPKVSPEGLVTVSVMNDAIAKHNVDATTHSDLRASIEEYFEKMKLLVGAPLKAETAAKMTDTARIYVYTGSESGFTNGAWYYYDSSTSKWTYGGLYNESALETDKELKTSDYAADAKVVGDKFKTVDSKLVSMHTELMDGLKIPEGLEDEIKRRDIMFHWGDSNIVDENGNVIIDENNNIITGKRWLVNVDATLKQDDMAADAKKVGDAISESNARTTTVEKKLASEMSTVVGETFLKNLKSFCYPITLRSYAYNGMPIIYLYGDADKLVDKSTSLSDVNIVCKKLGLDETLKEIKVQGSGSVYYPKKNFTLKFNNAWEAKSGWGKHKKYVLKANWVDTSQVKNVICANLWGQIRASRVETDDMILDDNGYKILDDTKRNPIFCESNPMLSSGLNYGAIDGFPCLLVINDIYWGMYTFTIPKDDWMAGMGGGKKEAIVSAELNANFKAECPVDDDGAPDGTMFSIEYVSDENNQAWVAKSLNTAINAVINATGKKYKDTCGEYIDIDSAMDYFILNCVVNDIDSMGRNYLLDTYDGRKWYYAAYDKDSTFGQHYSGSYFYNPSSGCTFKSYQDFHRICHLIYTYDTDALIARYNELRTGVLSETNIWTLIMNYANQIPLACYDYENLRWPQLPSSAVNNLNNIFNWLHMRFSVLDAEIAALLTTSSDS